MFWAIVILIVMNIAFFVLLIVTANRVVRLGNDLMELREENAELQSDFIQQKNESRRQLADIRNRLTF